MLENYEQSPAASVTRVNNVFASTHSSSETIAVAQTDDKKEDDTRPLSDISQLEKGSIKEDTSPIAATDVTFPDGGWEAWGCVFGTFWLIFFSFGGLNSFGVYQQYYATHLLVNKTTSQITWIGSFQFFFVFGSGAIAGRAFDLGYLKPLLAIAIVLLVFCEMMVSLSTQYWQLFLAQGVGCGLAMGFIFNLCIGVPSHWFKKRRGMAMGILASGAGAGSTVLPIMVKKLIPAVGFPWTMRIIAFVSLLFMTGSFFLVKTRLAPVSAASARDWIDVSAFKMKSFSLFVVGATVIMFGMYTPQTFINTFTSHYKIPGDGYWLSVLNASSIFGRLIPGMLADRYGKMTVLLPHLCIATVLLFIFPVFNNLSIIAFAILFGYCAGCYVSLVPICVNQLGPTTSAGARMGTLFSLMSIAGLFGTPIAGQILGQSPYNWWACVGYSGACATVGLFFVFMARHYAARELTIRP